jgi:hypothetical protein
LSSCHRILLLVLTALLALPASGARVAGAGQLSPSALLVAAITPPLRVLASDGMEHEEDPSAPDALRVEGTPRAQTGTYPLIDSVLDFR